MPIPSNPSFLTNVLGYAAEVNTIPNTTPAGTGAFSYQSGFPAVTSVPLTAGGIAPDRLDFNAVIKLLSQHIFFQQSGSLYTWSSSLDYLKGAHILGSNGVEYVALQSSGPSTSAGARNPVSDTAGTYWRNAMQNSAMGEVPIGGSIPFTGTFGGPSSRHPIPLGETEYLPNWVMCDGQTTNGRPVPDLRGRFVMAASDNYPAGSTGGSATHSHTISGTVGKATLTVDQLASHQHWIATSHNGWGNAAGGNGYRENGYNTDAAGGSQSHTHSLSSVSSSNANSLPPYYTLAFIIRTA